MLQAFEHSALSGDHGLGLRDLRRQAAGVEAGQHLALLHHVALLDQDLGNALAAVEGQRRLPELHVAVESEAIVGLGAWRIPPAGRASGAEQDDASDNPQTGASFHALTLALADR